MCACNPNVRTPYCGKIGCQWPAQGNSPQAILAKHSEAHPKMTVAISVAHDGSMLIDFSSPTSLGELFLMKHIFFKKLDSLISVKNDPFPLDPAK